MKITQELLDDWSGPGGYSDLQKFATLYKFVPYDGGYAIVGKYQHAIEARTGGHMKTIPVWETGKWSPFVMTEPDFSLDEITLGQDIILELQRD